MRLKKLKLENYRCFKELEIEFDDEITVLVGDNGAGKTSVLSAASIAAATFLQKLDIAPTASISKSDARIDIARDDTGDNQMVFPVRVFAEGIENGEEIKWMRALNSIKSRTTLGDAKEMVDVSIGYNSRIKQKDETLILPVILYYGTGRLYDSHREKRTSVFKKNNRLNGYIDCLDSTANIKLMYNWFYNKTIERYQQIERGEDVDRSLEFVCSQMEKEYQSVSGFNDVKVQFSISQYDLMINYTDHNGNRMRIPVSWLSAGYRNTLSLIADVSYRIVTLNPNLKERAFSHTPGVVMIDEIDEHLHPAWQHRIIDDLRELFPAIQFIVTTHSPSVISSVKSKSIRSLDGVGVITGFPEVYGKDSNSIMNAVMKVDERQAEVKNRFKAFYHYIDSERLDEARMELEKLEKIIDSNDSELIYCWTKLDLAKL